MAGSADLNATSLSLQGVQLRVRSSSQLRIHNVEQKIGHRRNRCLLGCRLDPCWRRRQFAMYKSMSNAGYGVWEFFGTAGNELVDDFPILLGDSCESLYCAQKLPAGIRFSYSFCGLVCSILHAKRSVG
ncbi:MAG TPA: hypothetical protein PKN93_16495, partial [Leptospiraceae bacterium]|nr:hypothetical protein [Leptospiraceae bacterium]